MGAGGPRGGPGREAGPGGAQWTTFGGPGFEDVDFGQFFGERFGGGGGGDPGAGFASMFDQFQRGAGGRKRPRQRGRKGADAAHEITIPFATAVLGGEVQLSVARPGSDSPETLSIKVPPGIEDGKKLRLGGQARREWPERRPATSF